LWGLSSPVGVCAFGQLSPRGLDIPAVDIDALTTLGEALDTLVEIS